MAADDLTEAERTQLGKDCRDYDGLLVRCFAAKMVGQSYPLPRDMTAVVLDPLSDKELGYRFAKWCDETQGGAKLGE